MTALFSAQEHVARFILKEHLNKSSMVSRTSLLLPDIETTLSGFGRCAVCFEPFLTTWVECVQFINLRKVHVLHPSESKSEMVVHNSGQNKEAIWMSSESVLPNKK